MRKIVVVLFIFVALGNTLSFAYYRKKVVLNQEDMQKLMEIRDIAKELLHNRAPRYDAPCYGAPGTPVPPQPALDAAVVVDEICCCLKSLLDECCESILDELSIIESIMDGPGATIDCTAVDALTTCPLINNTNFNMIQWLKAIFWICNHRTIA